MMSLRCRLSLLWFLTVLLTACPVGIGQNSEVVPITDRAPPIWLRVIPEEPGFFHGVGFTSQSNDPAADQKQAALRAREAMVGEITSSLKRSLSGNGIEAGMWERLSWEGVLTDLEQLPPADVYLEQHKHRVWAYVKVGRADFSSSWSVGRVSLKGEPGNMWPKRRPFGSRVSSWRRCASSLQPSIVWQGRKV